MRFRRCVVGLAVGLGAAACHRGHATYPVEQLPDRATWIGPDSLCTDSSPRWIRTAWPDGAR